MKECSFLHGNSTMIRLIIKLIKECTFSHKKYIVSVCSDLILPLFVDLWFVMHSYGCSSHAWLRSKIKELIKKPITFSQNYYPGAATNALMIINRVAYNILNE